MGDRDAGIPPQPLLGVIFRTAAGAETGCIETGAAMQPHQSTLPVRDDARWASVDILRITIGQLRAWEAEARRYRVVTLPDDEQAWEGTEIDVRRTVL